MRALRSGDERRGRTVGWVVAVAMLELVCAPARSQAGNWGGSLDLTSDYFVRGISRSNDQPALQLSLYYSASFGTSSGVVAGISASNAQIAPQQPRAAELSAFFGYTRTLSPDWQTKVVISNYSYPWSGLGSQYNYDEADIEAAFRGWLNFTVSYSPNFPRFDRYTGGIVGVSAKSAELNLERPLFHKLSVLCGIGYFYANGRDGSGYTYWSAGAAYDWAPVTLTVSYIDATEAANSLFYNSAYGGKWMGSILWRF